MTCAVLLAVAGIGFGAQWLNQDSVDADVVAKWRTKLAEQDELVSLLEQRSQAQSAAVGKQLAQMQARLLRMEAIGAHMADGAELDSGEFDFTNPPAQGGPAFGEQGTMDWQSL